MKQESTAKYILRLTATLLAICAVVALALAGVNSITAPAIAALNAEKTQKAIETVLPGGGELIEVPAVAVDVPYGKVYKGENGYAVKVTPLGFDNTVTMMVGVSADGKVLGISIIKHAETPSLGAVAAAGTDKGAAFRGQFAGLVSGISIGSGENQIDSISGATITSQAIVNGVNAALECVKNLG